MVARGGSPLARGGSPLGRRASRLAPPRVAARHRRARLCIPPPPAAWCADCGSSAIPLSHRHGARALLKRRDGDIAPYRHYAREVRTAITSAKYAPPLSRVAPAPTGTTCEKGRTSTQMPALVVYRKPCPLDYERRMSASLHNAARYASTSASGVRATPSFIAASATAVATVGRSMSSKGFGMM